MGPLVRRRYTHWETLFVPNRRRYDSPMIRLPIFLLLFLIISLSTPAFSSDFEKGLNASKSGDYVTALRERKPLAEQGLASAQFNLGVMYNAGKGVPQDYKTAGN